MERGKFTSPCDFAILEDASGRIQIRENENFLCSSFVTGSIVALLGKADSAGYFMVQDYCYSGIPFKAELAEGVDTTIKRELFDKSPRNFALFFSGLNIGGIGDSEESQQALFLLA